MGTRSRQSWWGRSFRRGPIEALRTPSLRLCPYCAARNRSEALSYYFRLEDPVPETHLLRVIEKHMSVAFVREKLKASYSDTGRPSIDPELRFALCC